MLYYYVLPADLRNFVIVISSGLLTSACVTFLITIAEYRIKRVEAVEDFCEANWELMKSFYNLKIFESYIPLELLVSYYGEKNNVDMKKSRHKAESDIKRYLWVKLDKKSKQMIKKKHKKADYLDATFNKFIEEQNRHIEEIMNQYIEMFERNNCQTLSNTYAKINFLFGNKKIRQKVIYERIYEKQIKVFDVIKNSVYHFKVKKGNNIVMIDYIQDIQECLFSVKDDKIFKSYYMKHIYEIDYEIHGLLKIIYGKKKYEGVIPDYMDYCCFSQLTGSTEGSFDNRNSKS